MRLLGRSALVSGAVIVAALSLVGVYVLTVKVLSLLPGVAGRPAPGSRERRTH